MFWLDVEYQKACVEEYRKKNRKAVRDEWAFMEDYEKAEFAESSACAHNLINTDIYYEVMNEPYFMHLLREQENITPPVYVSMQVSKDKWMELRERAKKFIEDLVESPQNRTNRGVCCESPTNRTNQDSTRSYATRRIIDGNVVVNEVKMRV